MTVFRRRSRRGPQNSNLKGYPQGSLTNINATVIKFQIIRNLQTTFLTLDI